MPFTVLKLIESVWESATPAWKAHYNDGDVRMVLGGGANHGRPPNVDVLHGSLVGRRLRGCDRRAERVQVHHHLQGRA